MSQLIVSKGHRGLTATTNIVKEKLQWSTMDADIKAFVQSCLVCTLSSSGSKVPRPFGQQIHAQRVSELLHFDFLYVGESRTGHEYILILKNDFSGYVFFATLQESGCRNHGQRLERVLHHFHSCSGVVLRSRPHFCNKVMQNLASCLE